MNEAPDRIDVQIFNIYAFYLEVHSKEEGLAFPSAASTIISISLSDDSSNKI